MQFWKYQDGWEFSETRYGGYGENLYNGAVRPHRMKPAAVSYYEDSGWFLHILNYKKILLKGYCTARVPFRMKIFFASLCGR